MRNKSPLVSVIIVNWNGGDILKDCLISLSKIDYPNWEIIIVDNGSTDESLRDIKVVKSTKSIKRIEIIGNDRNLGFTVANNQGYGVARGKFILLLNNDTKVESDFLTKLVSRMNVDPTIGVVQPKIYLMDKPGYLDNAGSFLTRIGFLQHWGFGEKDGLEFDREREIFSAKGACMLIRRQVIEKVGLFDDDFISYFEESDFCWRVWLAGWRVLYYPGAKIYHKVGFTIKRLDVINLNFHYYKNRISSLIKNLNGGNLLIILPLHLLISIGIALAFLLCGKVLSCLLIIKALGWNLANLGKIWRKRQRVQKLRTVTDRMIFSRLMVTVNWHAFFRDFRRVEKDIRRKSN